MENLAAFYADDPEGAAASHGSASVRVPFMVKDRRGWQEFADALAEHPAAGSANTLRRVQGRRPNLYGLKAELAGLEAPLLVMAGDEDEPCLEPSLWLKRTVPMAGLVILPRSGHTLNLEEPALFNQFLREFLDTVEAGAWTPRDPRSDPTARSLGGR